MAIKLNPSKCCCGSPHPTWTVYHKNVSDKLHFYILDTANIVGINPSVRDYMYFVYDSVSGDKTIYKNCIYEDTGAFSGIATLSLFKTTVAPTGLSTSNNWIYAARIDSLNISGVIHTYSDNIDRNVNIYLNYDSSKESYVFGNHYCGCSGFSGALIKNSGYGDPSGLFVFPGIGARIASRGVSASFNYGSLTGTIRESCYVNTANFSNYAFNFFGSGQTGVCISQNVSSSIFPNCSDLIPPFTYIPLYNRLEDLSGVNYYYYFNSYCYPLDILAYPSCCNSPRNTNNYIPFFNIAKSPCPYVFNDFSYNISNICLYSGDNTAWGEYPSISNYGCFDQVSSPTCLSNCGYIPYISNGAIVSGRFPNSTCYYSGTNCSVLFSEYPILSDVYVQKRFRQKNVSSVYLDGYYQGYCSGIYTQGMGYYIMNNTGTKHILADWNYSDYFQSSVGSGESFSCQTSSTIPPYLGFCITGGGGLVFTDFPGLGLYYSENWYKDSTPFSFIQSVVVNSDFCVV